MHFYRIEKSMHVNATRKYVFRIFKGWMHLIPLPLLSPSLLHLNIDQPSHIFHYIMYFFRNDASPGTSVNDKYFTNFTIKHRETAFLKFDLHFQFLKRDC